MTRTSNGFWEDGFRVTWAPTRAELVGAHSLRADVFCRELRWVGSSSDDLERDRFDDHCTTIVVIDPRSEVVATVRLVAAERPWMFDEVFRPLIPDDRALHRAGSVEASRLAVARTARRVRLSNGRRLADLLFKSTYLLCGQAGVRYAYMVTSDTVARRFTTAGLPCALLASPTRMPDGVMAVPLVLDWEGLGRDAPLRAWFEQCGERCCAPPRLDLERTRRAPSLPAGAQPWDEDRVRASG
jgi:N-acyl-L-homoserine lactone synthetase